MISVVALHAMNSGNVKISVHERYPMILPKDRDPRFITIRRGGTLTDSDHHLLTRGQPRVRSTSSRYSSWCDQVTHVHIRRLKQLGHGHVGNSK